MTEEPLFELPRRVQPQWTEKRAARVRAAIERRVFRRRATRWAVATSSLLVAGGLAFAFFVRYRSPAEVAKREPMPVQSSLPRGTPAEPTATPLTADTELIVDPRGAGRAFLLRRGSARFVVPHDERRPFRVRVGALVVEDLGTVFSVARLSDTEFDVAVEEGRVAVLCADTRVELGRGQRRAFTCEAPGEPAAAAPLKTAAPSAPKAAERSHLTQAPAWRALAEQGQYREAYDMLRGAGRSSVRDEAHELLLAADTARLSGHPSEAVPYLRRVLGQHGEDPRAHLAAFTLGRVLLDELSRPAEAAEAFARARARARHAPLAEDALAREIEAWARAGDARRAHALALEYQRDFPRGRRLRAVSKFGGLE